MLSRRSTLKTTTLATQYSFVEPFTATQVDFGWQDMNGWMLSYSNPGPPYKSGSGWVSMKREQIHNFGSSVQAYRGDKLVHSGRFRTSTHLTGTTSLPGLPLTPGAFERYNTTQANSLYARGSEAYNRMRPDLPDFSFTTSIIEMRDTPRMLKDALRAILGRIRKAWAIRLSSYFNKPRKKSGLSKIAEYNLALQFGWLPLLSDIRKFVKAQKTAQGRLNQLIRDNKRWIKRKRSLNGLGGQKETLEMITQAYSNPYGVGKLPTMVTQAYGSGFAISQTTRSRFIREWASGEFRYLLPDGPQDVIWRRRMIRRIMGARVTPSQVFQAMPWTWLASWFIQVDEFVKATSMGVADKLVSRNFFVMRTTVDEVETTRTSNVRSQAGGSTPHTSTLIDRVTHKQRLHASPFGFGFTQGGLSPNQIGLLGSLGFSRLP